MYTLEIHFVRFEEMIIPALTEKILNKTTKLE